MTGAMSFEDAHRLALFEQMNGGRQTGNSGTNDTDIDLEFAFEDGRLRSLRREGFPQTLFA